MSLKSNFVLMAAYNQCMNNSFYSAASTLGSSDLAKNQNAYFGSIINTLNHILVGDTIWLKRIAAHSHTLISLEYVRAQQMPTSLDTILFPDFKTLREKREKMDSVIQMFVAELSDAVLSQPFSYTDTKGVAYTKQYGYVLQHFFNHQSHHRGQVSNMLYQQGIDVGITDLLANIPNFE